MRLVTRAATVLAALTWLVATQSCSNDRSSARSTPEPTPDAPSESVSETASETEYSLLPQEEAHLLEPGRWAYRTPDGPAPLLVLDVPAGFHKGESGIGKGEGGIGYWLVDRVFTDPCSANEPPARVGASVEDLVTALSEQELTTTTASVPVSVDGHDGRYLELTTPADLDYDTCDRAALYLWDTSADEPGWRYVDEPATERYWILDVDGQRVVLDVYLPAGTDDEDAELFTGMVEAASFVPGR